VLILQEGRILDTRQSPNLFQWAKKITIF